jgi:hypothetical protein
MRISSSLADVYFKISVTAPTLLARGGISFTPKITGQSPQILTHDSARRSENGPVCSGNFSRSWLRRTTEVVTTNLFIGRPTGRLRTGTVRGLDNCPEFVS